MSTGLEAERRKFMADNYRLYDYVYTLTESRAYDMAADTAGGAKHGQGAANRCYALAARARDRLARLAAGTPA